MIRIHYGAGFTLLELLVALAVFAIIAVAAYSGLQSVLSTRAALEIQAERLNQLQMAFYFLERDIEQAAARSVRDEFGQRRPALQNNTDGYTLVLTRNGWDNPLQRPRASLQRVAYRLDESRLIRLYWDKLDLGGFERGREAVLLDQVEALEMRFLDRSGGWVGQWPPAENAGGLDTLPLALEWRLTLSDWGEITRLFRLPGA